MGSKQKLFRLPLITTIFLIVGFCCIGLFQSQRELIYQKEAVAAEAERVELEISETLNQTSRALRRYTSRIEFLGVGNKEYLDLDSRAYLDQLPILKRIGLIDQNNHVYWAFPHEIDYQVMGFNQSENAERLAALEQARTTRKPSLSKAIELKSGGPGFLLPVPLFPKGKFAGFVYATIEAEKLFNSYTPTTDFQVSIHENGHVIFTSKEQGPLVAKLATRHEMTLDKSQWTIEVTPTEKFVAEGHSHLALYILLGGILVSLVIGWLLQKLSLSQQQEQTSLEWRKGFIDSSNYAIISTDAKGTIKTFNHAATLMLGYEPEDVIDKCTPKIFHIKEESIARAEVLTKELGRFVEPGFDAFTAKAKALRTADENEWTFVRKDQSRFPANLSVTAFYDSSGEVLGYLGVCVDITEKKKAQEQLQEVNERLMRVIEATEEGIWEREYIPGGKIRFLDSQGKIIYGFKPNEEPTYEQIIERIVEEDRPLVAEALKFHERNKTHAFEVEFRMAPKGGAHRTRWIRARGKITEPLVGTPLLVSTIRDVTEEVEKRQQLKAALIAAEEATKAKSEFLANMSHEIRTPINGVIGMTGLLLDGNLGPTEREYAETVQSSAEILLSLVNDILDFSKIEARKLELEYIDFDIDQVTQNIRQLLDFSAKKKGLQLMRVLAPDLPTHFLNGDPNRISQILTNLISNAVKFTEQGQISIAISHDTQDADGKPVDPDKMILRIEVTDTGIGMSPAALARMFQPFNQADASTTRRFGGTGLGLSICKHLAEMMDGQIGVRSEEGRGSTFWFTVVLTRAQARGRYASAEPHLLAAEPSLQKMRILLAEDNPVNQFIGRKILEKCGVRVDVVGNGNEAIDALNSVPYDLVLMDCQMPELDGYETSIKIRASKNLKYRDIPIVAMTANAVSGDREKCLAAGMDGYVTKPIQADQLVLVVQQTLQKKSGSKSKASA